MKKTGLVLSVIGALFVVVFVIMAIVSYGNTFEGYNYIYIGVNPKIEFVCDGFTVVSVMPINEEAKELVAQEKFVGLHAMDAAQKFIDLCTRSGYIDINSSDNAIIFGTVADYSYVLENKVYNSMNNYLVNNQILGVIIEADQDNDVLINAKENGISGDKLLLIESCIEKYDNETFDSLKELSISQLVEKIKDYHESLGNPENNYTEAELTNKRILLDFNRVRYANHLEAITPESLRVFKETYKNHQITTRKQYQKDFDTAYNIWKKSHTNFVA